MARKAMPKEGHHGHWHVGGHGVLGGHGYHGAMRAWNQVYEGHGDGCHE